MFQYYHQGAVITPELYRIWDVETQKKALEFVLNHQVGQKPVIWNTNHPNYKRAGAHYNREFFLITKQ